MESSKKIRTRFAPSPTGHLHIGGARTALYAWLFARGQKGEFLLRIEDTDRERSTDEFARSILEGLRWLGLDWDGEPVYQSRRMERHVELARGLLEGGSAYRCVCTSGELEEKRTRALAEKRNPMYDGTCRGANIGPDAGKPFVVRFAGPKVGETVVRDVIQGPVIFGNEDLDDLVILRADGTPTYNFSVVCDDRDMGITHVIRGDDHLKNTARQILLYRALGFAEPDFAHLPLILGEDKKRLSKRHGAASVIEFRRAGVLPEALVNFLARIGWSHGDEEVFTVEELIEKFSLENVGRSAGVFNYKKLLWLNATHLRGLPLEELARRVRPFLEELGVETGEIEEEKLRAVCREQKERWETLKEIAEASLYFFKEFDDYDPKGKKKFLKEANRPVFEALRRRLADLPAWDGPSIDEAIRQTAEERSLGLGKVAQPLRVALTGRTFSPGIFEVAEIMGRRTVLERIDRALAALS